jgi:hypothetical protein
MCDLILNPALPYTDVQKSGLLVPKIRDQVSLDPQCYHTFVEYLDRNRRRYGRIVDILDKECPRQPGMNGIHFFVSCSYRP